MDKRINKVIDTHILTPGNNAVYIHNHCNSWKVKLNQNLGAKVQQLFG